MKMLSNLRYVAGLYLVSAVAIGLAPGCTESDDNGGASGGKSSGGKTGTGGQGGEDSGEGGQGASPAQGGQTSQGGDTSTSGQTGVGGDSGGAGGAGGAPAVGKTCEAPTTDQMSALGKSCQEYCATLFTSCGDFTDDAGFDDQASCVTTCQNFGDEQLCCRAYYGMLVASENDESCEAAAGNEICN